MNEGLRSVRQCFNCKFWDELPGLDENGFCKRHAPVQDTSITIMNCPTWPMVHKTYWCGDHEYAKDKDVEFVEDNPDEMFEWKTNKRKVR